MVLNSISNDNNFSFNENIFKVANKLNNINNLHQYYIEEGHIKGLIFCEKQLKYYYNDIELVNKDDNIFVNYNDNEIELSDFCKKYIYEKDTDFFLNNFSIIDNKINNCKLCCILHIGNIEIGIEIINKLKF